MRIHGKSGIVYLGVTRDADASPVAYLSDWSVSFTQTRVDYTAIGDETHRYLSQLPDVTGDFSGFYDDATAQLYAEATDTLARRFYLYPQVSYPNRYFCGLITADLSINGGVTAAVAIKSSWAAAAPTVRLNTDFVINVHASIAGQGSCIVLPAQASGLQGQGVIAATPTISAPPQQLVGAGQCSAIPRTALLAGAGTASCDIPTISVAAPLAGHGTATARPTIGAFSDPDSFQGAGNIVIPGRLSASAIGDGEANAIPIIGARALLQGAGAAAAAPTQAIGATASIAGLGVCTALSQVIAPPYAQAAAPGQTWKRMFHRQRQLLRIPAVSGSAPLTLTVTATQGGVTGPGTTLRVFVLTQAATTQNGATAVHDYSPGTTTVMSQNIITTQTGSRVYGCAQHGPQANNGTAGGNTTLVDDLRDAVGNLDYVTFKATALTGTPGSTAIGFSFSGNDTGPIAMYEVLTAGALTEDAGAPAFASAVNALTVSTASFTAPGGSLLVALALGGGGSGVCTMTVSGGSLIWSEKAKANASSDDYAGVWLAQVP